MSWPRRGGRTHVRSVPRPSRTECPDPAASGSARPARRAAPQQRRGRRHELPLPRRRGRRSRAAPPGRSGSRGRAPASALTVQERAVAVVELLSPRRPRRAPARWARGATAWPSSRLQGRHTSTPARTAARARHGSGGLGRPPRTSATPAGAGAAGARRPGARRARRSRAARAPSGVARAPALSTASRSAATASASSRWAMRARGWPRAAAGAGPRRGAAAPAAPPGRGSAGPRRETANACLVVSRAGPDRMFVSATPSDGTPAAQVGPAPRGSADPGPGPASRTATGLPSWGTCTTRWRPLPGELEAEGPVGARSSPRPAGSRGRRRRRPASARRASSSAAAPTGPSRPQRVRRRSRRPEGELDHPAPRARRPSRLDLDLGARLRPRGGARRARSARGPGSSATLVMRPTSRPSSSTAAAGRRARPSQRAARAGRRLTRPRNWSARHGLLAEVAALVERDGRRPRGRPPGRAWPGPVSTPTQGRPAATRAISQGLGGRLRQPRRRRSPPPASSTTSVDRSRERAGHGQLGRPRRRGAAGDA